MAPHRHGQKTMPDSGAVERDRKGWPMRRAVIPALVLTISLAGPIIACMAQQAGRPKTLEDLLEATETVRTEGTLSRPRDGSHLPAVDKAWQQYDAAVQSATARLLSAIDDLQASARRQGDADAAAAATADGSTPRLSRSAAVAGSCRQVCLLGVCLMCKKVIITFCR